MYLNNKNILKQDIFFEFNLNINNYERIDELVKRVKKFNIDFTTVYFNQPDRAGHDFGPESNEYKNMV